MNKRRLLFSKTGRAKYISHLDLMRTMQRVFLRAGIKLRHTEGFNPHPYMSFALPLSVSVESLCELMDFELLEAIQTDGLPEILNLQMPAGIEARTVYEPSVKFSEIAWIETEGTLVYDRGVKENTLEELATFFKAKSIIIAKKSKKGMTELDIIPCIDAISFDRVGTNEIRLKALLSAQNPSLNPENLIGALEQNIPSAAPDFVSFRRLELYNGQHETFR
jgi:radical SAM-linked protein